MRKVIQIAAVPSGPNNILTLWALCDDGAIYEKHGGSMGWPWLQITDIPQDPEPAESPEEVPLKGETGPVTPYNPKAYYGA